MAVYRILLDADNAVIGCERTAKKNMREGTFTITGGSSIKNGKLIRKFEDCYVEGKSKKEVLGIAAAVMAQRL